MPLHDCRGKESSSKHEDSTGAAVSSVNKVFALQTWESQFSLQNPPFQKKKKKAKNGDMH